MIHKKKRRQCLKDSKDHLLIGTKSQGKYIIKSDIVYIQACECYSWIFTRDGLKFLSSKAIGYYEELFSNQNFSRIHRSFLINLSHLKQYEPSYRLVHLKGEIVLSVSHRKNRIISKMINNQELNTLLTKAI
ncbi:LytTR family DNA-binding domain-containing protein [uncultured Kordia sp.]|uniref:LytR/AlgR family response regulator transcription factor n=1 Tax=uncultured Kordia sp. TaxID=507699 RepID=UPI00260D352E|nr:LytTR family DNA-binding domain-containing protein [uncultured Kordia sp.]